MHEIAMMTRARVAGIRVAAPSVPLLMLLIALMLRLARLTLTTDVMNLEGAEYVRLAENLVHGNGYVGLAVEGRQLMFPPLYPMLIAAASFVTRHFYTAAQLVSMLAGLVLLLPVLGIARSLYGADTARTAMLLTAVHPVFVSVSADTLVEGLYITLVMAAVYYVHRCQHGGGQLAWMLAGSMFGLAYLTCPQAIVFPGLLLVWLLCFNRPLISRRRAAVFVGSFGALALPYIAFLSLSTGSVRFEGKSIVNNELGRRILSGVPLRLAEFEVTPQLVEAGVWMRSNADVLQTSTARGYWTTLDIMRSRGVANVKEVVIHIADDPILGAPLLLPLVALGLWRRPWTWDRAVAEGVMILVVAASVLAMMSIGHHMAARYYYVLLPFLTIWLANGVTELKSWALETTLGWGMSRQTGTLIGRVAGAGVTVLVVGLFVAGTTRVIRADEKSPAMGSAAAWLAAVPGEKTIMDTTAIISYHAGARYVPLPWCDSRTAVAYARKKNVDFIVVRSWEADTRPYLNEWLRAAPDPDMALVRAAGDDRTNRILIYRLNQRSAGSRAPAR